MGDTRNRDFKAWRDEQVRISQARLHSPSGPLFVQQCDGCHLKGFHNPKPSGGFIRFYVVSGGWQKPDRFYCEFCLEAHTGEPPYEF